MLPRITSNKKSNSKLFAASKRSTNINSKHMRKKYVSFWSLAMKSFKIKKT